MRVALIVIALMFLGCDEQSTENNRSIAKTHAQHWLDDEVENQAKLSILGINREFVEQEYIPTLLAAKENLDELEDGNIYFIPLLSYARPANDGSIVIWVWWLQADKKSRHLLVEYEGEVLIETVLPSPDSPYLEYSTYLYSEPILIRAARREREAAHANLIIPVNLSAFRLRVQSEDGESVIIKPVPAPKAEDGGNVGEGASGSFSTPF